MKIEIEITDEKPEDEMDDEMEMPEDEMGMKPKPGADETRNEWMGRCIPMLIEEGKEQPQAIAICANMWESKEAQVKGKIDWYTTVKS